MFTENSVCLLVPPDQEPPIFSKFIFYVLGSAWDGLPRPSPRITSLERVLPAEGQVPSRCSLAYASGWDGLGRPSYLLLRGHAASPARRIGDGRAMRQRTWLKSVLAQAQNLAPKAKLFLEPSAESFPAFPWV